MIEKETGWVWWKGTKKKSVIEEIKKRSIERKDGLGVM